MPKMRGFKPELWTDEKFVDLEPFARLLFMGMWTYACDNGHLDDKPKQIKMRVLPTDEVDPVILIDQMVDLGMVVRKAKKGLLIPKLREHQRLDNRYFTWCDRCTADEIPEPARSKYLALTQGTRREPDVDTACDPREHAVVTREGRKEGTEGEGESEGSAASAATTKPPRKKSSTSLPSDWLPNDEHMTRCLAAGLDPATELAKFKAHAEANDRRQVNWNAAFTQWLLSARPTSNVRPLRAPNGEGPDDWMRRRPTP